MLLVLQVVSASIIASADRPGFEDDLTLSITPENILFEISLLYFKTSSVAKPTFVDRDLLSTGSRYDQLNVPHVSPILDSITLQGGSPRKIKLACGYPEDAETPLALLVSSPVSISTSVISFPSKRRLTAYSLAVLFSTLWIEQTWQSITAQSTASHSQRR